MSKKTESSIEEKGIYEGVNMDRVLEVKELARLFEVNGKFGSFRDAFEMVYGFKARLLRRNTASAAEREAFYEDAWSSDWGEGFLKKRRPPDKKYVPIEATAPRVTEVMRITEMLIERGLYWSEAMLIACECVYDLGDSQQQHDVTWSEIDLWRSRNRLIDLRYIEDED